MKCKIRPLTRNPSDNITPNKYFTTNYYSPEKLQRASRAISTEQKFISTDDFFSAKIRNELNISPEVEKSSYQKYLCKGKASEYLTDRKILSDFRSKMYQRSLSVENTSDVEGVLQILHQQTSQIVNKQRVQIKSKLKTRFYKKIFKAFNVYAKKKNTPQQSNKNIGLFFKPPLECMKKHRKLSIENWVTDSITSLKQKEQAKAEIENFLCVIREEMNNQGNKQNELEERKIKEGNLALSTQKGLRAKMAELEKARESISKALAKKPLSLKGIKIFKNLKRRK
ncbi:hypothetical protein SteCoe_25 [Stentor coeruleus]|uniref:Uncharacterized protein n=1 Tax=Stentor coeruleus TaxID=5963 RepID=A0A1R2D4V4_9CILI|nr:hypothetical protein SteCoe_25 [Stentor coeruleus]